MCREELHQLVDTLPEAALEPAEKSLRYFQKWPPIAPPEIERIGQERKERMLRSMPPGTSGKSMGGASYTVGCGGRVQGRLSFSHSEEGGPVMETHHFHQGHEITIIERLRTSDDGKMLIYANEIAGPNGKTQGQEVKFEIG